MNNKACEGCTSLDLGMCLPRVDKKEGICPCTTCLIKMVCSEGCTEYAQFAELDENYHE